MKAKDRYGNSFTCVEKRDMIFSAFGVKIREDDLEMLLEAYQGSPVSH